MSPQVALVPSRRQGLEVLNFLCHSPNYRVAFSDLSRTGHSATYHVNFSSLFSLEFQRDSFRSRAYFNTRFPFRLQSVAGSPLEVCGCYLVCSARAQIWSVASIY